MRVYVQRCEVCLWVGTYSSIEKLKARQNLIKQKFSTMS